MNKWKTILATCLLLAATTVLAQGETACGQHGQAHADSCCLHKNPRPGSRSLLFGIGSVNILDTYISQEEYRGTEVRIIGRNDHWLKKHPSWHRIMTSSGSVGFATPRADNVKDLSGLFTFAYAMRHEWRLGTQWSIEAGAQAEAGVGFLYNTRNSNNPAQARLYLNLGPSAAASYNFSLFRKAMRLQYEVTAPLVGLVFSPNYGQSYYEIFSRGNYDHNVVPTTTFCAPTLRHSLTLDIPLRRSAIRIGYMGDIQQAEVNNLKYHTYSHLFLIGYHKNI